MDPGLKDGRDPSPMRDFLTVQPTHEGGGPGNRRRSSRVVRWPSRSVPKRVCFTKRASNKLGTVSGWAIWRVVNL